MLLLAFALLTQAQAPDTLAYDGRGGPTVPIPRIDTSIVVDGSLDESVWDRAAVLTGFSQYEPVDGRPAEERTEVRVWYSPTAIHFGVLAWDRQPGAIRATRADRDNIDNDDQVTIYLDTFHDRRRAFFFAVNPLGIQQDGVRSEGAVSAGNLFGGTIDRNPDYAWNSRGQVTDQGYVVEIRIPFKSLRYPSGGPQTWGINVLRRNQRTGYNDTWTDVRRANASFLVQAGSITGLHDMHRGIVFEAQPFVTATANGARDPAGTFTREDIDGDAGATFRVGLTNLSLDGTINPDFSQVESDEGQVTLNERFALFFPEKRPFFLEGIELFSTPSQLVYTRQIANPAAGVKLTGKFGRLGVAHLTAVDEVTGADDALFNITRVRSDFGSNSVAGVTLTDRSVLGTSDYNRVVAGDIRYVFAKLYFIEAQVGNAWTRESDTTRDGPIWKLEFDRTGRSWGFNYAIDAVDDDFVTRAGFVNRTGIVNAHVFNRLTWYGARGALVENFTTFFGPTRIWRYGDIGGDALEGGESLNLNLTLRGGWQLRSEIGRDFVDFDPADYADYTVDRGSGPVPFVPAEGVSGPDLSLNVSTPVYRKFDASLGVEYAEGALFPEAARGHGVFLSGSLGLRPSDPIRITFTNSLQWLYREDGSSFARTVIPRLKLEYQATRSLFFRLIGEYRSERRDVLLDPVTGAPLLVNGLPAPATESNGLRVDALASFEPTPGTVAFLGYGSQLETPSGFGFRDLRRLRDGFFLKLAYQFRR